MEKNIGKYNLHLQVPLLDNAQSSHDMFRKCFEKTTLGTTWSLEKLKTISDY